MYGVENMAHVRDPFRVILLTILTWCSSLFAACAAWERLPNRARYCCVIVFISLSILFSSKK